MSGIRLSRRTVLFSTALLAGLSMRQIVSAAQEGAQATIEALQTEVAAAKSENSHLQTQVAATSTPTAESTREPISDEPIEIADGLVILNYRFIHSGIYRARSLDKATWVVGEMQNETNQILDAPAIQFILTDDSGNIIDSFNAYPILRVIQPGQVMPFQSGIFGDEPDPSEWTQEQVSLCSGWGSTNNLDIFDPSGLSLENIETESTKTSLSVSGVVRNSRGVPAENVWVKAAIYDAQGRIAGWCWTFLEVAVPAGKTARFSFDSNGEPHDPVGVAGPGFTYELWVGPDSSFSSC